MTQRALYTKSGRIPVPPVIMVMGPTASGKTALAVRLARRLGCEIISVDSAMVYRGMDIGTAKPSREEQEGIVHHLIDILDPAQAYSAGQFRIQALELIRAISATGKIPLLVGGTMLYFSALLNGLAELPSADPTVRAALDAEAERHGWGWMHRRLADVDPVAASRIHPNDPQRIQRALEVFQISGRTLTDLSANGGADALPFKPIRLIVEPSSRTRLHEAIAVRFRQMLTAGLVNEVEALFCRPDLHAELPSIRAVGYRQIWTYLNGDWDFEQMQERAIIATRQLAKRQLTWLRRDTVSMRYDATESGLVERLADELAWRLERV